MDLVKRKLASSLLAVATLTTTAASVHAVTYAEPGDAGQTLATAANTGLTANGTTNTITGTIGTATDADLYIMTLSNTTTFSATATGGASSVSGNGNIDVSLFLFDSTGTPVIANDDSTAPNYFISIIPSGNSLLTTLSPGTYYLGISLSGNEPVNANNQNLFTLDQPTTSVRGAASGLNPTTESTFNGATYVPETGTYAITFSATAPEPSTVLTLVFGAGCASLVFLRRLRRQQPSA